MQLRTSYLAACVVLLFSATSALAFDDVVAVSIDGQACKIAASDNVNFWTLRKIISALKSQKVTEVSITGEPPEKLARGVEFVEIRWKSQDDMSFSATKKTKVGYVTSMIEMLYGPSSQGMTVSMLPDGVDLPVKIEPKRSKDDANTTVSDLPPMIK